MSELKPCPMCGSLNIDIVDGTSLKYGEVKWAVCADCELGGILSTWNNRPHEAKIKAEAVREATPNILSMAGSFWKNFYRGRWVLTNKLEKGEL